MIKKTMHEKASCMSLVVSFKPSIHILVCHAVDLNRENALTTPPCE